MTAKLTSALARIGNPDWTPNWTMGGIDFFGEIVNTQTNEVWLCQHPITRETFKALVLPEQFSKVGIGRAAHDLAYFRRSPGTGEDGPLETMEVDNLVFSKVAKPGAFEQKYLLQGYQNFFLLSVYKYHIVQFAAGRTIEVLTMEDGSDYVPNIAASEEGMTSQLLKEWTLPEDWSIRKVTLQEELVVEIPCPSRVCFFNNGYGFHGPVVIPV